MFRAEAEAEAKVVEEVEAEAEARLAARPATHETGAAVVAVAAMGARVIVAAAAALLRVHLVTARAPRNHGLRAGRQWSARFARERWDGKFGVITRHLFFRLAPKLKSCSEL